MKSVAIWMYSGEPWGIGSTIEEAKRNAYEYACYLARSNGEAVLDDDEEDVTATGKSVLITMQDNEAAEEFMHFIRLGIGVAPDHEVGA